MYKPTSTSFIYDGGTNKRAYANWRKEIVSFNASQDYIFSQRASNRERPNQSQQIMVLLQNRHHIWTHQETAAKQKVEQTKREWNERMQASVDHLKNSIGPNIKSGLQDLWFLTSSDQDADFTFRDIFRRIEREHGPTPQDIAKSRRQIMTEIMTIPAAQNDHEVQKSFNKLTSLCFELANIRAAEIPFHEIKEIATSLLIKECFQIDRSLINARHGHRRPHNLSDIIQIWRQCAEDIRQYSGQSTPSYSSSSKIAATSAAEREEQQSDEEEEEVIVAAFTSRPPAGQPTFSDSKSYYHARFVDPLQTFTNSQPQQQQRPHSQQQQRLFSSSRPRQTEPTPGQSKLITRLQETDSYKTAEIEFLRYSDRMQRRQIEELQQQQTQQQAQRFFPEQFQQPPFQQSSQQPQQLQPPNVLHQQQQQIQQQFQRVPQPQPYFKSQEFEQQQLFKQHQQKQQQQRLPDNSKRRYAQAFTIEDYARGDFSRPTYRPILPEEDSDPSTGSDPSLGFWG